MSVSNVINGRFDLLRPETRARIEAAIAETGYRPHAVARSLRRSSTMTVGMLVIDETRTFLGEPFIAELVDGLGARLGASSYGLLLQSSPRLEINQTIVFENGRTDAVCVFLEGSDRHRARLITRLARLNQPIIAFQEIGLSTRIPDVCIIRQRDFDGGAALAKHVLEKGAKRIVILTPGIMRPGATQRLKGMLHGLGPSAEPSRCTIVLCGDMSFESTQQALKAHLARHKTPDTVMALNDQMGIAAMRLFYERGMSVPGDVRITGFNSMAFRQYTAPILTTVRSQAHEMGQAAADAILNRLESGFFAESEIVLPVDLEIGGST